MQGAPTERSAVAFQCGVSTRFCVAWLASGRFDASQQGLPVDLSLLQMRHDIKALIPGQMNVFEHREEPPSLEQFLLKYRFRIIGRNWEVAPAMSWF
jgi:hypothetical protein